MSPRRFLRRVLETFGLGRTDQNLRREIACHLQLLEDELIRRGMTADDAHAAARRAFGSTAWTADAHEDARSFRWIADAVRDVRYAVRTLRRARTFTLVAIVTLALGIGASTAIFTLIEGVLLQLLPVRDPQHLVLLGNARRSGNGVGLQGGSFDLFSHDLYLHLRSVDAFAGLCAMQSTKSRVGVRRPAGAVAEPAWAKLVSGNYFDVLGTTAVLGRTLRPEDDGPSAPPVAVVSFRYWKERLQSDASAVGRVVLVDGVAVTIVGVAAPEFFGDTLEPDPPGFWIPISADRHLDPVRTLVDSPNQHWLYLMGQLAPSVTMTAAEERISAALRDWLRARAGDRLSAERAAAIAKTRVELTAGGRGITHTQRTYSAVLRLLLAISATVLLIACANIAALLLARGAAHDRERSIRLALGASRGRLIRQSLTESLTLALAGGSLGLLVASWGAGSLVALVFRDTVSLPVTTSPDVRVVAFAFAVSCAAAIVFGTLPALRGSADGGIRAGRRFAWTTPLIVGQVALAIVVLTAAGALARSLANLARQPLGFDAEHVLVVTVDPARAGYTFDRLGPLYREMHSRLGALPGVQGAALSYYSPFNECCWAFDVSVDGVPQRPDDGSVTLNRVSPGYFETIGTRLVRGRTFNGQDTPASPRVAIVNEAFVRRFLPDVDPIGRHFGIGSRSHRDLEIVGVVENAKYESPRDDWLPMAFLPLLQIYPGASPSAADDRSQFIRTIEVRGVANASSLALPIRQALAAIDSNLPVLRIDTMIEDIERSMGRETVVAVLAAFFALVALGVTCIGLYGSTAYSVERRTREIAIRMALGAHRSSVIGTVIRQVHRQTATGLLIGLPAALAALRLMSTALYGVSSGDPRDFVMAAIALLGSVTAAGLVPARHASRIDPTEALRQD